MLKRAWLPLLTVLTMALAACGDADGGSDKVTITFVHAHTHDAFTKTIAAFEKRHPDIEVKQQSVPFDSLNATIQSRLGSRDPSIDVYHADEPRIPALAQRGFLADLSAQRARVSAAVSSKAIEAVSHDGKLYAYPQWTSTQLLYYNKRLLRKAGVAEPAQRPTWEQVTAAARKAQAAGARWGFAFEQIDRYYQLQPLADSLGGGPGLPGEGLLDPAITGPAWVKAMDWYRSLFEQKLAPRGIKTEQIPQLFANGQLAYLVGGTWNIATFRDAKDLDFGIAPHPFFAGGRPITPTDSWAVGISPFSRHQAAARTFAEFLTIDPQGAALTLRTNPSIPVQKQAFAQYLDIVGGLAGKATETAPRIIRDELQRTATGRPRSTGFVDFEEVMNKAFADIRSGAQPAQRLKRAAEELDAKLARLRR